MFSREYNSAGSTCIPTTKSVSAAPDVVTVLVLTIPLLPFAPPNLETKKEREAELSLSLRHPNIVRCLGTFPATAARRENEEVEKEKREGKHIAFLVFEYVPGTLLDLIEGRPGGLSLPEVRDEAGLAAMAASFGGIDRFSASHFEQIEYNTSVRWHLESVCAIHNDHGLIEMFLFRVLNGRAVNQGGICFAAAAAICCCSRSERITCGRHTG